MLSVRDDVTKSTAMSEDVETAPSSEQRMTFRVEAAGPIGLGLKDRVYVDGSMVVVSSVDDGTPAAAQGVPVGYILRKLNGESVVGLDRLGVIAKIGAVGRPLEMVFSWSENANIVPDASSSGGGTSRLAQRWRDKRRQVSEAEEADKV